MERIKVEVRNFILQKYCKEGLSYRDIAKIANCSKSAVYKIIKKFGENHTLEDLPTSRRRKGPVDQKKEEKAVELLMTTKMLSVRDISKQVKVSVGTVQTIKRRNNIRTYEKQKTPKRSAGQKERSKIRSGKLYKTLVENFDRCILMDDETYVKLDTSTLPGPQFYNVVVGDDVPDEVRSVKIDKFGKKVLVWQVICSCGLKSTTNFTTVTIGGEDYRKECMKKRLFQLYRKHDNPPLIWPDLASAHYADDTLELLNSENIDFVHKGENPPNCPELRPIERYWAIVKRHLRKDGREANSVEELKKLWTAASRKVTREGVQRLMSGIKQKVRKFYRA